MKKEPRRTQAREGFKSTPFSDLQCPCFIPLLCVPIPLEYVAHEFQTHCSPDLLAPCLSRSDEVK